MVRFFKTLKRIRQHSGTSFANEFERSKEGHLIIPIEAPDLNNLYDTIKINRIGNLAEGFITPLDKLIYSIPTKEKIELIIKTRSTPAVQEKFLTNFRTHSSRSMLRHREEKKHNNIIGLICLCVFVALCVTMILLQSSSIGESFDTMPFAWEGMIILMWIFCWEAIDRFFFAQMDINKLMINKYKLFRCPIKFVKFDEVSYINDVKSIKEKIKTVKQTIKYLDEKHRYDEEKIHLKRLARLENKLKALKKV